MVFIYDMAAPQFPHADAKMGRIVLRKMLYP